MTDSLGDRIKRYERASTHHLTPNSYVFIRVDGKSFHTYTKQLGCDKPFDTGLIDAMVAATVATAGEMQGFKLAYTQSDEATFLLTDTDTHESQGWFDNNLNKLVSIAASAFTMHFNRMFDRGTLQAMFDARAFVVPGMDVPNVFVWRQKDWVRNSVQMLAQVHFSHKELVGKKTPELHDMLMLEKSVHWSDLTPRERSGTWVLPGGDVVETPQRYESIARWIGIGLT